MLPFLIDAVITLSNCTTVIKRSWPAPSSSCHHTERFRYEMPRIFIHHEFSLFLGISFVLVGLTSNSEETLLLGLTKPAKTHLCFHFITFLHTEMAHSLNSCLWMPRTYRTYIINTMHYCLRPTDCRLCIDLVFPQCLERHKARVKKPLITRFNVVSSAWWSYN